MPPQPIPAVKQSKTLQSDSLLAFSSLLSDLSRGADLHLLSHGQLAAVGSSELEVEELPGK